jgi:hypothetical protein
MIRTNILPLSSGTHKINMETILWRIDPMLGTDIETNNKTTAVAKQRRGKHASTTIDLLLETVFSIRSVQSSYLGDN